MSHLVRRTVRILSLLSSGNKLTTGEIAERIEEYDDEKVVTLRQIQRDLRAIVEAGIPLQETIHGRSIQWSMPALNRVLPPLSIDESELLSLHMLKGTLATFKGTRVERDVRSLAKKLETLVPGRVFMAPDIVSDVSPGRYATAVSDEALKKIVDAIVDPHWDRVTYRNVSATEAKTFVVSFCRLVNHAGRLYVAAWHPRYEHYITLAADRIDHVERANDVTSKIHVFNEKSYRARRFGVYDGNVEVIKLNINKNAAHFFTTRTWHPTQQFTFLKNGNVELTISAPLSPELISWIVSWADVLTIRSPKRLKQACVAKVESLLK